MNEHESELYSDGDGPLSGVYCMQTRIKRRLTGAEKAGLARENERLMGMYLSLVKRAKEMEADQSDPERILEAQERARQIEGLIIEKNENLIHHIVAKIIERRNYAGEPPFLDLVNEGKMGFLEAIRKYEAGKGTTITSWAYDSIEWAVGTALKNNGRDIYLPQDAREMLAWEIKYKQGYFAAHGRTPTEEEIKKELKAEFGEEAKLAPYSSRYPFRSLDSPVNEDGGDTMADFVAAKSENRFQHSLIRYAIDCIMESGGLSERQTYVMDHSESLLGGLNNEQIAKEWDITRDVIRKEVNKLKEMIGWYVTHGLAPKNTNGRDYAAADSCIRGYSVPAGGPYAASNAAGKPPANPFQREMQK